MAFLDHIDPGNSGGSVPTPKSPFPKEFKPIIYSCPICGKIYKNLELMQRHRVSEHPIKRPMLLIDGQPQRKDQITVRTPIKEESITFYDVDEFYINDELVEKKQKLIEWLCNTTPLAFQLRLMNQNYPVEYTWFIDIADNQDLEEVDKQFYNAFDTGLEITTAFGLFNERISEMSSSAAKNYAAGLSCYVTAVITKDQLPGATLVYDKYNHKLGEAMDILIDYRDRPLAKAIMAISEFMQNDFSLLNADNRLPKLDSTKRFFNNGHFVDEDLIHDEKKSIPIDTVTDQIINFCADSSYDRNSKILDIEIILKADKTDNLDRMKVLFGLWVSYISHSEIEKAKPLRGKLIHHQYFGELIEAIEDSSNE